MIQIHPETLQRHSAALACQRFKGHHTHDRVAKVLADIHKKYGLEDVVATVTDNASEFVAAFKVFGRGEFDDGN